MVLWFSAPVSWKLPFGAMPSRPSLPQVTIWCSLKTGLVFLGVAIWWQFASRTLQRTQKHWTFQFVDIRKLCYVQFIFQSKRSLHQPSVETGTTDPDFAYFNLDNWKFETSCPLPMEQKAKILWLKHCFCNKWTLLLDNIEMYVLRSITIRFKQKYGHET